MSLPSIDTDALLKFLEVLLNTPSPTGYHEEAMSICQEALSELSIASQTTRKGGLVVTLSGVSDSAPRGLTAHVDTLGAMVQEVKSNGRLKLTQLGGWSWGAVEGEGVTIITHSGSRFRGTILPVKASVHIFGADARNFNRDAEGYEVRIDARTDSAATTREQGIDVGDFVVFDPRVEITESEFIRSRHLDDKASVACIYAALRALNEAGIKPTQRTTVLISNYEEVGHGASSGFPPDLAELLAVDIGVVGGSQNSDEFSVTIGVKDSGGPYHIAMNRILFDLCESYQIPYKRDIFPYYGSDGEAFWRAGGDVIVGLVGPGVDSTHHYERTHRDALIATTNLILAYLLRP
jgi:putative aminopeptidase FrvX